jgi:hypothetical protein
MAMFALFFMVTAASIGAGVMLAIPANLVARRLGQSPPLFTILALVPYVNFLFFFVVGVLIGLHVLDRLNAIHAAVTKTDR